MGDRVRPARDDIFFDTESVEDGRTIMPISLGMVSGKRELYVEFPFDREKAEAHDFVRENVLPHLQGKPTPLPEIRRQVKAFAGHAPRFWAWYAAYDWMLMCQVWGTMVDLPAGWPMFCMDLRQSYEEKGCPGHRLPRKPEQEHHALEDARWAQKAHRSLYAR